MPANDRDKKVREEAQYFCKTKSLYPLECKHFKPTLEELQSTTFSDYVRNVVLSQCAVGYSDDENEDDVNLQKNHEHGTRSSSNIDNNRRHKAGNRKISYDYGKLFCCALFSNGSKVTSMSCSNVIAS